MKNLSLTKKVSLAGLILTGIIIVPLTLRAAPTDQNTPATACAPIATSTPAACQTASSTGSKNTASTTVAQRQACDAAKLAQDQANLKAIRQCEDGPQVQLNYDTCKSEYAPTNDGTQPGGSGDQYVPVHETGDLLSVAQSTYAEAQAINTNTGKAYDMQVLLCMYLHAIKRVNYAMEDLAFIKEPDMRRQAATQVEQYRQGIFGKTGLVQTGGSLSGEFSEPASAGSTTHQGGSPVFPKNPIVYQNQAADEGRIVFKNNLETSSNNFKAEVTTQLSVSKTINPLNSTLPRATYDQMISGNTKTMTSSQYLNNFTAMFSIEAPNNPLTAYMIAQEGENQEIASRIGAAMSEYSAGGGILPIRKCAKPTADGKSCDEWETVTPGSVVAQSTGDALAARLNEYENPAIGQVGNGNEPTTNDVQTFTATPGIGGGTTGGQSDPGNGGGTIPSGDGGGNDGGGTGPTIPAPYATIMANNLSNGNRVITWGSVNTTYCSAGNDWLGSTDPISKLLTVIKSKSAVVQPAAEGSITIYPPLRFTSSWTKNGGAYSSAQMATSTSPNGNSLNVTWSPSAPAVNTDSYTLRIQDGQKVDGFTITVGGTQSPFVGKTAKDVVQAFYDFWKANKNIPIYQRYIFTYDLTGGKISISVVDPIYQLECKGEDGSTFRTSSAD